MCRCHLREIGLPDIGRVADRNRNDRAFGSGCDLEAAVMERQHFCFINILISGSFREDTYGNAGFHIVCGLKDRFQTLLDILSVEKETVEIAHPVGKQRIMLHFLLGNIAGADRTAAVGEQDVEIAPVVCYIENSLILWNVFFADDGDFGACDPQDEFEYGLYHAQRADILSHGRKFPDDPFYKENRNGQHQIGDHHDTDKYESNHVFCPFCYRYLRRVPQ